MNLLCICCLILLLPFALVYLLLIHFTLPSYNEILNLSQKYDYINSEIKIYRDSFAIPHIQATSYDQTFFGLGYSVAQDRLWQLHFRRMATQGRLSEILGEKGLQLDKFIRNIGYLQSAREISENIDSIAKKTIQVYFELNINIRQAYADGINEGVRNLKMLPIEFQIMNCQFFEWTIYDSIVLIKYMSFSTVNDFQSEVNFIREKLREIYGDEIAEILGTVGSDNMWDPFMSVISNEELKYFGSKLYSEQTEKIQKKVKQQNHPITVSEHDYFSQLLDILPDMAGSNCWAISGKYTESGSPYLANDPHLENSNPSSWYLSEHLYGDEFIIGATIIGIPFHLAGRTESIALGTTILRSDVADLFEEKIQGKFYEFKGEWLPLRETIEVIKVKNKPDVNFVIQHTHHGPILQSILLKQKGLVEIKNKYYSFQSSIHVNDYLGLSELINAYKSKDISEAQKYIGNMSYPSTGCILISKNGSIGYTTTGRLAISSNLGEAFIRKGWTGQNEWIGYVPSIDQPRYIDPPKGYFITANNKFLPDKDKYQLARNVNPTSRAKRIDDLIKSQISKVLQITIHYFQNKKFSILDQMLIQTDTLDKYAELSIPLIIDIIRKCIDSKIYDNYIKEVSQVFSIKRLTLIEEALSIWKKWDFKMDMDTIGGTIYQMFEFHYLQKFNVNNNLTEWVLSQYMFDSFNIKNLHQLHEVLIKSKNMKGQLKIKIFLDKKLLDAVWCGNQIKAEHQCIFNILDSALLAMEYLYNNYGGNSNNWKWSHIHYQFLGHQPFKLSSLGILFNRKTPFSGNRRTVSMSYPDMRETKTFQGESGANLRVIVSMDPKEKSYYVLDTGISGNVLSPHYDDQLKLWSKGEYIEMVFGNDNLYRNEYLTVLKPFSKQEKDEI